MEPTIHPEGHPAAARHELGGSLHLVGWPLLVFVVLIGGWELASRAEVVSPIILPPASEVAEALARLVQRPFFWEAVQVTLTNTLAGFGIGCAVGFGLGAAVGSIPIVRRAIFGLIVAFENTPRVAFAPLFLTWFGFGAASKVVMAAAICFFPLLINVVVGIETVDEDARTVMRSYGASRWQLFRKLTLPSSLPIVFAGLKTAMTLALVGAIVAEFVGASEGMGVLIEQFNFQLNVAEAFAVIVSLAVIGLVLYGAVEVIDRRLVFWRNR